MNPVQSFLQSATFSTTSEMVFSFCLVCLAQFSFSLYFIFCYSFNKSSRLPTFFLKRNLRYGSLLVQLKADSWIFFLYFSRVSKSASLKSAGVMNPKMQIFLASWKQLTEESKQSLRFCSLSRQMTSLRQIYFSLFCLIITFTDMGQFVSPSFSKTTCSWIVLGLP